MKTQHSLVRPCAPDLDRLPSGSPTADHRRPPLHIPADYHCNAAPAPAPPATAAPPLPDLSLPATTSDMASLCRMKVNKRSTSDIISNLPSNITENILKVLPLRDAVRTSVLSSRWRYKWATLPQLVFNCQFFLEGWDNEKLKAVIAQVLSFHQGPLIKFLFRHTTLESCPDINKWFSLLLTKDIQDFAFSLCGKPPLEIPYHFYSFLKLRDLQLCGCVIKPPPTFKGFKGLVDLSLVYVDISTEMCGLFISSCPLLEKLRLVHCTNFDSLKIIAPNLKFFEFGGILASVSLENTPLLAVVSVTLDSCGWHANLPQPEAETDLEWSEFFYSLPAIENMQLNGSFLELFAAGDVPRRLPSTLNQLKVLILSDVCYCNRDHVSWALCLLRSSPNVHRFWSYISDTPPQPDHATEFLQAQDFTDFSLNQLLEVEISDFSGVAPEMHFVKILLAHAVVLKKMVIWCQVDMYGENEFAKLEELTRFPRASLDAEIFIDPMDPTDTEL